MSKYFVWCVCIVVFYAYLQFTGRNVTSYFTGNTWNRAGQSFNHK